MATGKPIAKIFDSCGLLLFSNLFVFLLVCRRFQALPW